MITKNFKKIAAALLCTRATGIYCFIPVVNRAGATVFASLPNPSASNGRFFPARGYLNQFTYTMVPGILAGSGTTPPTENDYDIEAQIAATNSSATTVASGIDSNGNPIITVTLTAGNNSNDSITITELGYFAGIGCNSESGKTTASIESILIDRTLLETPVTIPADGLATITYTLKGVWNEGA